MRGLNKHDALDPNHDSRHDQRKTHDNGGYGLGFSVAVGMIFIGWLDGEAQAEVDHGRADDIGKNRSARTGLLEQRPARCKWKDRSEQNRFAVALYSWLAAPYLS